jgi:hypothetical protein
MDIATIIRNIIREEHASAIRDLTALHAQNVQHIQQLVNDLAHQLANQKLESDARFDDVLGQIHALAVRTSAATSNSLSSVSTQHSEWSPRGTDEGAVMQGVDGLAFPSWQSAAPMMAPSELDMLPSAVSAVVTTLAALPAAPGSLFGRRFLPASLSERYHPKTCMLCNRSFQHKRYHCTFNAELWQAFLLLSHHIVTGIARTIC